MGKRAGWIGLLCGLGVGAVAAQDAPPSTLPAASPPAEDAVSMDTITVVGEKPADLLPAASSAGSRLDLSPREQVNVVQVVSREFIESLGAASVHEALEFVAGVRPVAPAYTASSAGVRVRGFEAQDVFVNGARLGAFGHPLDDASIEQLEVLKGPASIQYGLVDPGGTLNIVTKRPRAERETTLRAQLGRFDYSRVALDTGGALDAGKTVLTRFNAAYRDAGGFRDFDAARTTFLAPAVRWNATENLSLELEVNYLDSDYRFSRGLNPQRFILDLPRERSFGEPNQPLSNQQSVSTFWTLEYQLGDGDWKLRQSFANLDVEGDVYEINTGAGGLNSDGRTLDRSYSESFEDDRYWTLQHELHGAFDWRGMRNKLVLGFERAQTQFGYGFYSLPDVCDANGENCVPNPRALPALDVFDPQYGGYDFPGRNELTDGGSPPEQYGNRILAFYADWQLKPSERWKLLAGLRLDQTRGYYRAIDRSVNYGAADSRGTSPRLGFVYTPIPALDLFGNYSTSFTPNLFLDAEGRAIDTPEKARQIEGGLRYDFIPERLRGSLAVFSIVKKNVAVADPNDLVEPIRNVLQGEQTSEGFELELAGEVMRGWSAQLGYSYYDARVTRDSNPTQEGKALVDAPENHLTAYTRYRFNAGPLAGLWLGYGFAYVDERVSSSFNPDFLLPSYTQHDVSAGFERGRWEFQLNADNLSDERIYYTHGNNIHLQPPVNLRASVAMSFGD